MKDENFVLFWSGPFSQWYIPCNFVIDDIQYNCTEQYMMAEKARLFKDEAMEDRIMLSGYPSEQKAFGVKVKDLDVEVWENVARDIVL